MSDLTFWFAMAAACLVGVVLELEGRRDEKRWKAQREAEAARRTPAE